MARSLPVLHPPFHVPAAGTALCRIERLSPDHTVELTIRRIHTGLVLQTENQLSGSEIEACSQRVWRMLRLDESFLPFRHAARKTPMLDSVGTQGARLLRGADLFEDVVTAVTATWQTGGLPDYDPVIWLVDRCGDPLPSNPTFHAFPHPEQILASKVQLDERLPAELAETLAWIARVFLERQRNIDMLTRPFLHIDELERSLANLLHLPPDSIGLVMLHLGRYDYVPTDRCACLRVKRYQMHVNGSATQDVHRFFEPWHPWGGLAYWLWDWSKVPMLNTSHV